MKQKETKRFCRNGHLVEDEQLNYCPMCGMPLDDRDHYSWNQNNRSDNTDFQQSNQKTNKKLGFKILIAIMAVAIIAETFALIWHPWSKTTEPIDSTVATIVGDNSTVKEAIEEVAAPAAEAVEVVAAVEEKAEEVKEAVEEAAAPAAEAVEAVAAAVEEKAEEVAEAVAEEVYEAYEYPAYAEEAAAAVEEKAEEVAEAVAEEVYEAYEYPAYAEEAAAAVEERAEEVKEAVEYTLEGVCGANLTWGYYDGTIEISGKGAMYNYEQPDSVPWTDIKNNIKTVIINEGVMTVGDCAFMDCYNLVDVSLPSSLTVIGQFAFCDCSSIQSIVFPDGLQCIEHCSFDLCESLISVYIPASVYEIYNTAFFRCTSMKNIYVDGDNGVYHSEDGVLYNKDMTVLVKYPDAKEDEYYTIPSTVREIGSSSFSYCHHLTSITIPGNVQKIGEYVFECCNGLVSIHIEDGVNTIGCGTIQYCDNLTNVYILSSHIIYDDYGAFNIFTDCPKIIVHAPLGSSTEKYVKNLGIQFVPYK